MNTVCRKVRQHRERLKGLLSDPDVRYDESAANKAVLFIESNLRHYKEPHAGKPFILEPWQKDDIIKPLFGYKRTDGTRLFRQAYIQLPRKNGKSALAAAILMLVFLTDGGGLEIYCAANKKDQARLVFDACAAFAKASPAIKKRVTIEKHKLIYGATNSVLAPLSAEYNSLDGLNISACSIDELHAHKDRQLHDVLITATGARTSPLVLKITTAGDNLQGICYQEYEYSEKLLNGTIKDNSYFAYIVEADKDLAWDSKEAYAQANPNLGVSISEEYLETERKKAIEMPSYRKTYEKYHLNRWVAGGSERWLNLDAWKLCAENYSEDCLEGMECYGALDLSATQDITAFSLLFPMANGEIRTLSWYWLPQIGITEKARQDKVPYDVWHNQGFLTLCAGNCIDYNQVSDTILCLREKYNIKQIAYDDWNAIPVYSRLINEGMDLVKFVQGLVSFHPPSMELERLILEGKLKHNNNPITKWMIGNAKVLRDSSGKIRPVKEHKDSANKIDGVISLIMALSLIIRNKPQAKTGVNYKTLPTDLRRLLGA